MGRLMHTAGSIVLENVQWCLWVWEAKAENSLEYSILYYSTVVNFPIPVLAIWFIYGFFSLETRNLFVSQTRHQ